MGQVKFNVVYTSLLYGYQKKIAKWFNISIIVISSIGAFLWDIWEFIPVIACILIAIMSLLKELKGELIYSEKQFESLNKVHIFYAKHLNEIEHLWYKLENGEKDTKVHNQFYRLRKNESEIFPTINENITSKYKKLTNKARCECDEYFTNYYNTSRS